MALTIQAFRWYLIYYMMDYGWSKLTQSQFGVSDPEILNTPLKDVDGAFLALTILAQILIIDISFTQEMFGVALPLRVTGMLICDFLIIYHYRRRLSPIGKMLNQKHETVVHLRWWMYLLLPLLGFAMDFVLAVLLFPVKLLLN